MALDKWQLKIPGNRRRDGEGLKRSIEKRISKTKMRATRDI